MTDATHHLSLRAALDAAQRSGLLLAYPGEPAWTRLTCPTCGGALDLPLVLDPVRGAGPGRLVRRVDAFAYRHQPGKVHQ